MALAGVKAEPLGRGKAERRQRQYTFAVPYRWGCVSTIQSVSIDDILREAYKFAAYSYYPALYYAVGSTVSSIVNKCKLALRSSDLNVAKFTSSQLELRLSRTPFIVPVIRPPLHQ